MRGPAQTADGCTTQSEPETALVGSIQKFSIEDGPGIRTTVFLKGCPLNCRWCHNPELIDPAQQIITSPNNCIGCGGCIAVCPHDAISLKADCGICIDHDACDLCMACTDQCYAHGLRAVARPMTIDQILETVEQDRDFYHFTKGGMTVSGGEVLMQPSFVGKLVDEAFRREIDACIDTCGFGSAHDLLDLAERDGVTHVLYDMKSIDDDVHRWFTGVSNQIILENLRRLAENPQTAPKLIMRMPLVANVNDTPEIITRTGELYRELGITQVTLLPYHNLGVGKGRNLGREQQEFAAPTEERLQQIIHEYETIFGLETAILGRV